MDRPGRGALGPARPERLRQEHPAVAAGDRPPPQRGHHLGPRRGAGPGQPMAAAGADRDCRPGRPDAAGAARGRLGPDRGLEHRPASLAPLRPRRLGTGGPSPRSPRLRRAARPDDRLLLPGGAAAGPDRPGPDGRPSPAPARRTRQRPRPARPGSAAGGPGRPDRLPAGPGDRARLSPPGRIARLDHPRPAAARRGDRRGRAGRCGPDGRAGLGLLRAAGPGRAPRRPLGGLRRAGLAAVWVPGHGGDRRGRLLTGARRRRTHGLPGGRGPGGATR